MTRDYWYTFGAGWSYPNSEPPETEPKPQEDEFDEADRKRQIREDDRE